MNFGNMALRALQQQLIHSPPTTQTYPCNKHSATSNQVNVNANQPPTTKPSNQSQPCDKQHKNNCSSSCCNRSHPSTPHPCNQCPNQASISPIIGFAYMMFTAAIQLSNHWGAHQSVGTLWKLYPSVICQYLRGERGEECQGLYGGVYVSWGKCVYFDISYY